MFAFAETSRPELERSRKQRFWLIRENGSDAQSLIHRRLNFEEGEIGVSKGGRLRGPLETHKYWRMLVAGL
jgi:hypothetical protein